MMASSQAARAGIKRSVYPHLLRHTFASKMFRDGVTLTEVALQLNQRSLNITMPNLHGGLEELRESIDAKFSFK